VTTILYGYANLPPKMWVLTTSMKVWDWILPGSVTFYNFFKFLTYIYFSSSWHPPPLFLLQICECYKCFCSKTRSHQNHCYLVCWLWCFCNSSSFNTPKISLSSFEISENSVRDSIMSIVCLWNRGHHTIRSLAQGEDWNKFFQV
jgi:hypothetical protein